jgi:hypothetical protein
MTGVAVVGAGVVVCGAAGAQPISMETRRRQVIKTEIETRLIGLINKVFILPSFPKREAQMFPSAPSRLPSLPSGYHASEV